MGHPLLVTAPPSFKPPTDHSGWGFWGNPLLVTATPSFKPPTDHSGNPQVAQPSGGVSTYTLKTCPAQTNVTNRTYRDR